MLLMSTAVTIDDREAALFIATARDMVTGSSVARHAAEMI
jgi:hypothetical protein